MARIIVVGAGFAGMSAAARLAKLRHDVVVLERDDSPGGLLRGVEVAGERIAPAPDDVTLPGVFRDLFRKSGRPMDAAIGLEPGGTRRHLMPSSGLRRRPLVVDLPFGTRGAQHDAVTAVWGSDRWSPWVDTLADPWDVLRRSVLEVALAAPANHDAAAPANHDAAAPANRDASAPATETAAVPLEGRTLQRQVRGLRQRSARPLARTLGVGFGAAADPRRVPAVLAVSHYVERNFGRWRFAGGAAGLADALAIRLGERRVTVETGSAVDAPLIEHGRAVGVRQGGAVRPADVVVWATGGHTDGHDRVRLAVVTLTDESLLADDLVIHGERRARAWRVGPRRWAVSTPDGGDPAAVLVSAVPQVRDAAESWQEATGTVTPRATGVPHPAVETVPGLWVVGGAAVPGVGLEVTGMGTAALAAHLGPVPR